jgi:glyceraldehyde 3-phosphate dehydrogenase
MPKIAINGMGRIGRAAFKIILDTPGIELAAVNDLIPADNLAYLLNYDSVYGRYEKRVEVTQESAGDSRGERLSVGGKDIPVLSEKDPAKLPWSEMGIDLVLECVGIFTRKEDLQKHLKAGAKRVILSAPSKSEETVTVVHSVNQPAPGEDLIISCASCTTNSIAPIVEIMGRRVGIKKAIMTTIHAYTSTQALVDGPNKRFRRGRAAAASLIPAETGAAVATTKTLPQYRGKFDGVAVRVPVIVGSLSDIVFSTERSTTPQEINGIFREEAEGDRYREILGVSEEPIVSSDIVGDPRASIVDLTMTLVVDGDLVKVMAWYDNEWGYTHQMIREALRLLKR